MPAYLIVFRDTPVRDADQMKQYGQKAMASMAGVTMTPKVVYGGVHPMEGEAPDGVVMLEFPSLEEAKAWYNGPAYQDALPHRLAAADWRAIIVEGV